MRAVWLLCVIVFPVAVQAGTPDRPEAPDSVHLRFGWRPGTSARVEFEGIRTRDGAVHRKTGIEWRLRVAAHERGLAVRTEGVEVRTEGASEIDRFVTRLTGTTPAQLVTESGEFVALDDVARYREAMLAAFDSMLASTGGPPNVRTSIAGLLSEGLLQSSAADEWNSIVGFWIGADLEVGETLTTEVRSPSPLLPQIEIPQRMEFGAVRRVPCGDGRTPGCVELRLVSVPDMERGRELISAAIGSVDPAARDSVLAAFESMQVENEVVLVTRPDGMFPQSVRKVRRTTARLREGGEVRARVQEDVKTTRYTWTEAPRSGSR